MEDIGGPRGIGIALCVAVATAASVSSPLTGTLGPKLEPLDPNVFWVSPVDGFGLVLGSPA